MISVIERSALEVSAQADYRGAINTGASAGSIVFGALGALVWGLLLAETFVSPVIEP